MKKACSACLTNCLSLHGAQQEDEDVTACLLCASRKPEEDERVQVDRNPSSSRKSKENEHVQANRNSRKPQEDEHVQGDRSSGKFKEDEHVQADRNPSFLKKMTESTMSTLKLPLSFVRDQIERLDGCVILEGPSREKWRVELQGSFQSFSLNFGQGWEKFVSDHVLQIDDLITFSLSAQSYFQVEVYDGGGCQKTSALDASNTPLNVVIKDLQSRGVCPVLRQNEHSKRDNATQSVEQHLIDLTQSSGSELRMRSAPGNGVEVAVNDMEVAENVAEVAVNAMEVPGLEIKVAGKGIEVPGNEIEVAGNEIEDAGNEMEAPGNEMEVLRDDMEVTGYDIEVPENEMEVAEAARSEDIEDPDSGDGLIKLAKSDQGGILPELHVVRGKLLSRRRSVTELEKERALQAAKALELANPNTLLVMSKTHVCRGFWLGISKKFAMEWMPSKTKEVALVNKSGHSWTAKWMPTRGGLSAGWRRFSLDHHLEEHDVCVFELIDKADCVLRVHIFRVIWCPGEDPGLYTPALTPDNKNKRKSSNGHEVDGTSGEGSERKNRRSCHSLRYQDVQIDKPTSEPATKTNSGKSSNGHEADRTLRTGSERKNKRSRRYVQVDEHTSEPDSATKSLKHKSGLLGDDKASSAKRKELASPNHQEIGTSNTHIIQKSVDQISSQIRAANEDEAAGDEAVLEAMLRAGNEDEATGDEAVLEAMLRAGNDAGDEAVLRAGNGTGDQVELGITLANADVGGEYRTPPRAAEGTPTAPQQVLALICCDYGKKLGKKNLSMRNGYRCAERPSSARADVFSGVHAVNPDEVHEQIVHAPATGPFRGRKVEKRQAYKVVHIYRGRNVGNGTEFLAELEGYSERRSFATLDRDDDTGFWWVPSEQFGWDMLHCYIG